MGGAPLKPFPKYSSLKVGDTVMTMGGRDEPWTLVSISRFKQTYGEGPNKQTVCWKKGTFLNLVTGVTFVTELDGRGVRGTIIRASQDKSGIPQPSEELSLREDR